MEEKKQKHFYNFKCSDCGHEWKSYGFGKRVICPNCYEKRTGKKLGQSAERMAEIRAMRNKRKPKEEPAAVSEDTVTVAETEQPKEEPTPPISTPQPEPKPQEKSFFREFLGF